MPSTSQAVVVIVLALLPGALYTWSFERLAGRWGIGLSDRLFRFVGTSALFHALFAPATYQFWSTQWDDLKAGRSVSWWLWALALGYVLVPFAIGSGIGYGTRKGWAAARFFTGPDPAPRAWDYLFQGERDGWIRLRLKSGIWLAGGYGNTEDGIKSYAAGYPEPQDLYLAAAVGVDRDSGEFQLDENGEVVFLAGGILVRWDEVEYLDFIDAEERAQ